MLGFKLKNINNPFKTRQGEIIVDLDRYVQSLKENNIPFTKDQYEEAKSTRINRTKFKKASKQDLSYLLAFY